MLARDRILPHASESVPGFSLRLDATYRSQPSRLNLPLLGTSVLYLPHTAADVEGTRP
jgi:hypothetical protein